MNKVEIPQFETDVSESFTSETDNESLFDKHILKYISDLERLTTSTLETLESVDISDITDESRYYNRFEKEDLKKDDILSYFEEEEKTDDLKKFEKQHVNYFLIKRKNIKEKNTKVLYLPQIQ